MCLIYFTIFNWMVYCVWGSGKDHCCSVVFSGWYLAVSRRLTAQCHYINLIQVYENKETNKTEFFLALSVDFKFYYAHKFSKSHELIINCLIPNLYMYEVYAHGTYSVSQGVIYIRFTCYFLLKYSRCLINSILGKFKIALITCIDCEDTCQVTSFFLIKQSPVLSFQLNQADLHLKVNKGSGAGKEPSVEGYIYSLINNCAPGRGMLYGAGEKGGLSK